MADRGNWDYGKARRRTYTFLMSVFTELELAIGDFKEP